MKTKWWPGTESNRRRQPFQGCALPTELPGHLRSILLAPFRFCQFGGRDPLYQLSGHRRAHEATRAAGGETRARIVLTLVRRHRLLSAIPPIRVWREEDVVQGLPEHEQTPMHD